MISVNAKKTKQNRNKKKILQWFLSTSSCTPEGSPTPLLYFSLTTKHIAEFQFIFIITDYNCYILLGFLFHLIRES